MIFVVYGFYRVGQSAVERGEYASAWTYLGSVWEQSDVILRVFVNVFFDGWYVLLAFMRTADAYGHWGMGLIALSALAKTVPGLADVFSSQFIPLYEQLESAAQITYRAKSFVAESYADWNLLGVVYFVLLGSVMAWLHRGYGIIRGLPRSEALKAFPALVIYSILFVNALVLIRSGIKVAYTWVYVEMAWFAVAYLLAAGLRGWVVRLPGRP